MINRKSLNIILVLNYKNKKTNNEKLRNIYIIN